MNSPTRRITFDRLRAKDSGYSYGSQVETISEVVVVDPHTVTFKLSKPTGPFLVYMAFPGSSIVSKAHLEQVGDKAYSQKPVGSGPFMLKRWVKGQVVELVQIFEGKILAVGNEAITVSLEGHPGKLDDFEELLRGYGIVELQRTGRIALPKLEREARLRAVKEGAC